MLAYMSTFLSIALFIAAYEAVRFLLVKMGGVALEGRRQNIVIRQAIEASRSDRWKIEKIPLADAEVGSARLPSNLTWDQPPPVVPTAVLKCVMCDSTGPLIVHGAQLRCWPCAKAMSGYKS